MSEPTKGTESKFCHGLCGEDAGGACESEEEGSGGVAGSVRFESMKVRELKCCTPDTHPGPAGLSLVLMFVFLDKSPESDAQTPVLNGFFGGRDAYNQPCSPTSIITHIPDGSECRNIIGSNIRSVFQLPAQDPSNHQQIVESPTIGCNAVKGI
jgi:hypothetical protein